MTPSASSYLAPSRELAARTLGHLFGAGSTIGLVAIIVGRDRGLDSPQLVILVAVSLLAGLALIGLAHRVSTTWLHILLSSGTVAVGVTMVQVGGGSLSIAYAVILVWVGLFAGYFFSRVHALFHTALAISSCGAALWIVGGPAVVEWVWISGTTLVAGAVAHRLADATRLVERDALTGCINSRGLEARLVSALHAVERAPQHGLSLILLDLDRFREFNDLEGQHSGDHLLVRAADGWRALLPEGATLARSGGDEFCVVLPGSTSTAAFALAEALRATMPPGRTCSAGVAAWAPGDSASLLMSRADTALYDAKRAGRNRTAVIGNEMDEAAEIWRALAAGEFVLHYQPIVDLDGCQMRGVEALARWNHPERGLVPPMEFIPLAERTGAIFALGRWVIDEACDQLAEWSVHGHEAAQLSVSVNLSPAQLLDPRLLSDVRHALNRTGIDPPRLCLEVTESAAMTNLGEATAALWELRAMGVRLAIDDFGTGYSSLARLRSLPFDIVKIDRSFVNDLEETSHAAALVRAMIAMGSALDLSVIAEGVEHRTQASALLAEGCEQAQGYLMSRPILADGILGLLGVNLPAPSDDTAPARPSTG